MISKPCKNSKNCPLCLSGGGDIEDSLPVYHLPLEMDKCRAHKFSSFFSQAAFEMQAVRLTDNSVTTVIR